MKIQSGLINPDAIKILRILESRGFQAYLVGGAVRDILMNQSPHDYDICTDALPAQIKEIFGGLGYKTVLVGEKYGTVQAGGFEITTFRTDNEYTDGRRPESVNFSKNIADDLKRRDFTVNALACSVHKNTADTDTADIEIDIIDIFGGQSDIKNKIIRAVGDPRERFAEDALRMMRAVRFSAQLGFEIEPGTKSAICGFAENITLVSKERIVIETEKILLSVNPKKFIFLSDLNLLGHIMPRLDGEMKKNGHLNQTEKIKLLEKDFGVRFAVLLEIYGCMDDLKFLRLKNKDVKNITDIFSAVKIIKNDPEMNDGGLKVFIKKIMRDFGLYVSKSAVEIAKIIYNIDYLDIMQEILSNNEPYQLSGLKIDGFDIAAITGEKSGRRTGEILSGCLAYVIENPEKNTKDHLIDFVKNIL